MEGNKVAKAKREYLFFNPTTGEEITETLMNLYVVNYTGQTNILGGVNNGKLFRNSRKRSKTRL
jgi:hypothetical protein